MGPLLHPTTHPSERQRCSNCISKGSTGSTPEHACNHSRGGSQVGQAREPTYFPQTTCPHLQPLPVAKHEAGGGGAAGPPPQLIGKAKGGLRRQVGMHGEQVAALPHLLLQKRDQVRLVWGASLCAFSTFPFSTSHQLQQQRGSEAAAAAFSACTAAQQAGNSPAECGRGGGPAQRTQRTGPQSWWPPVQRGGACLHLSTDPAGSKQLPVASGLIRRQP